jgi:hypothetical protein
MRNALALAAVVFSAGSARLLAQGPINSAADPNLAGGTIQDFTGATAGNYSVFTIGNLRFSATRAGQSFWLDDAFAGSFNSIGRSLQTTFNGTQFDELRVDFLGGPVSAFGFRWGAADFSDWTISAFTTSGVSIFSRSIPATMGSNAGDFFGIFSTSSNIGYALIGKPSSGFDYVFIDNFTTSGTDVVASVPEPASILLMGTGLLGLGYLRRRNRK